MKDYLRLTRTATYGFWSALPLLLAYEVLITVANRDQAYPIRVGADVWMKRVLYQFEVVGHLWLGIAVLLIGLAIYYTERHRDIKLRPLYFGGMLGEAVILAIVLPMLVQVGISRGVGLLPALEAGGVLARQPLTMQIALSIGAGIYEELVFRVLLFGGLYLGLKRLTESKAVSMLTAGVAGALIFSAVHYIGPLGDPFDAWTFSYRFLFGLLLTVLYVARGFGVAAWTHALYDLMVVFTLNMNAGA